MPTYYEATVASEDMWSVGGVSDVDNELLVGLVGEAVTDVDLAAACAAALDADKLVPRGAVTAVVTDGWVTLGGEVRHHYQRKAAKDAVRRVDGILGITDTVEITADPIPSDVVGRINKAFGRNAIIDDSQIKVSNSGHTIYLDGTAGSWAAQQAAEDAASGASS